MTLEIGVVAALGMAGTCLSAFLGAYAKRKGEDLATKEDLDVVVEQTRVLTETTKRIEATVSHEMWNRQRQWELKRDHLLAALEPLGRVDGIVTRLIAARNILESDEPNKNYFTQRHTDAANDWLRLMNDYDGRRRLLLIVCSRKTHQTFDEAGRSMRNIIQNYLNQDVAELPGFGNRAQAARDRAFSAAREELGLDPLD